MMHNAKQLFTQALKDVEAMQAKANKLKRAKHKIRNAYNKRSNLLERPGSK